MTRPAGSPDSGPKQSLPVAQPDRASAHKTEARRFESCRARFGSGLAAGQRPSGFLGGRRRSAVTQTGSAPLYKSVAELYNPIMATFNISKAREKLSDAVELSQTEAVFLERRGTPAAVLVSPERYEEMMDALEDAEDVAAFDSAMEEEGPNIPWDEVKADLGWD